MCYNICRLTFSACLFSCRAAFFPRYLVSDCKNFFYVYRVYPDLKKYCFSPVKGPVYLQYT